MKEMDDIREAYQNLVNKTVTSIKSALEKGDFAGLDWLRVAGAAVFEDCIENLVLAEVISEEQALLIQTRWETIEDVIDKEERKFTGPTDVEVDLTKDQHGRGEIPMLDYPDMVDEGWGG